MKGLALLSHSKDALLTYGVLETIASALTRQLCQDYANVWQSQGVKVTVYGSEALTPADHDLIVVFDKATDPGLLGYHDVSPDGKPYGKVFWEPILHSGGGVMVGDNSLSVTLSHEALELIEDPYANAWNDMQDAHGTEDAHELCDRCEGDSYLIDGVSVSNFLGPRAFRLGSGPYDFLGMQGDPRGLKSPFEIRATGYAIRRTGGPHGTTRSIFGAQFPEHKKVLKMMQFSKARQRNCIEAEQITGD